MKLIIHNMLTSNIIKGVSKGYPLAINATKIEVKEVDFNPTFIARLIPKLEWPVLCQAAESIGHRNDLPDELGPDYDTDEAFLKKAHRVIMEVEVEEGELICPESGRKFPINKGVANMLLNEDEV